MSNETWGDAGIKPDFSQDDMSLGYALLRTSSPPMGQGESHITIHINGAHIHLKPNGAFALGTELVRMSQLAQSQDQATKVILNNPALCELIDQMAGGPGEAPFELKLHSAVHDLTCQCEDLGHPIFCAWVSGELGKPADVDRDLVTTSLEELDEGKGAILGVPYQEGLPLDVARKHDLQVFLQYAKDMGLEVPDGLARYMAPSNPFVDMMEAMGVKVDIVMMDDGPTPVTEQDWHALTKEDKLKQLPCPRCGSVFREDLMEEHLANWCDGKEDDNGSH